jgi:enoyl-CoA hydratase
MSSREFVTTSIEENICLITIDHPPVNTLNPQTLLELEGALEGFSADPDCKVAIISGGDKPVFVSGADLAEAEKLIASGDIEGYILRGQRVFQIIANSSKPVIAAINGLALGGGMELALACHLRIMSERAKMAQPEIGLGIIPGWGGTQRLPQIVGLAKATELILTGESISAREALRINLVNMVVPRGEVLKAARQLAARITGKSTLAVRAAMESIRMSTRAPIESGLAFKAAQITELTGNTDARHALRAFLEKRSPGFRNE